jgi:hypothetical protein
VTDTGVDVVAQPARAATAAARTRKRRLDMGSSPD